MLLLHIALSYDEEVGCLGVPGLIAVAMKDAGLTPSGCIVGEPTDMRVIGCATRAGASTVAMCGAVPRIRR